MTRNPTAEAAQYRRRLRACEDALQQTEALLDAARWALVDLYATDPDVGNLASPLSLRRLGPGLLALVGDDGMVDPVRVARAAQTIRDDYGLPDAAGHVVTPLERVFGTQK